VTAKELWELTTIEELFEKYGPNKQTRDRFKISILLVDGLDEIKNEYREDLLKKASKFADELNSALIVSTRKIDLVKKETIGYQKRLLLPFEFGQALKILGRLAKDDKMLEELKEGLRNLVDQMPLTALSLLFLVELVESNKEIPASLTELYDRFTNMALGMDDKSRKGINLLFDYKIKRRFLGELAYTEFFSKNQSEITRIEFDDFISKYSKEYRMDDKIFKEFIDEIERAGLLELGDRVRFTHKSILDFFIAVKIDDSREEIDNLHDLLTEIYYDDMWCEVTTFFAGLRETISIEMINEILSYTDGEEDEEDELMRNAHKLLFGKMIQAAWHSKSDTKLFGIESSIKYSDKVVEKFLKLARERNPMMPAIYADLYSLILCEMSFGSRFLLNENKLAIEKLLEKPSGENLMRSLRLLWSIKDKTPADERRELLDKLYGVIKKSNELTGEEYAKCLLMIRVIALKDQVISKAIEKKLQSEFKKNPQLFSSKLINLKKQSSYTGRIKQIAAPKKKIK
jgi:hypothetical protein